jgi:hypothetical protein
MKTTMLVFALVLAACGSSGTCPATAPMNGDNCGSAGLACEFGGDIHDRCTTTATCQNALDPTNASRNAWSVVAPAGSCMTTNDSTCAATYSAVQVGGVCPTSGTSCDYDEGRCTCVPCTGTAGLAWECRAWGSGTAQGCPMQRPLLGAKCSVDGVVCSYDSTCNVSFGPDVVCTRGSWQPRNGEPNPCAEPICGVAP